jgi:hypothetical protein
VSSTHVTKHLHKHGQIDQFTTIIGNARQEAMARRLWADPTDSFYRIKNDSASAEAALAAWGL